MAEVPSPAWLWRGRGLHGAERNTGYGLLTDRIIVHEPEKTVRRSMLARLKEILDGQDYVSKPNTICRWFSDDEVVYFEAPNQYDDRAPVTVSGTIPGDLACQVAALIDGYGLGEGNSRGGV